MQRTIYLLWCFQTTWLRHELVLTTKYPNHRLARPKSFIFILFLYQHFVGVIL